MMTELTIDDKIKLLERKLSDQQELVINVSGYCNWKIVGKYFLPRLIKEKAIMSDIFRELREVTRQAYPGKFINSGGS
jgi:hypothetical protein